MSLLPAFVLLYAIAATVIAYSACHVAALTDEQERQSQSKRLGTGAGDNIEHANSNRTQGERNHVA